MVRFLPFALLPILIAGAWRREGHVPPPAVPHPPLRREVPAESPPPSASTPRSEEKGAAKPEVVVLREQVREYEAGLRFQS
jgi:hypothetical protein